MVKYFSFICSVFFANILHLLKGQMAEFADSTIGDVKHGSYLECAEEIIS